MAVRAIEEGVAVGGLAEGERVAEVEREDDILLA